MDEPLQCYTPVLLPVVCFQQAPHYNLPPPSVSSLDDSSDRSRTVEGSDDIAFQLECAVSYEREWYEVEDRLFVRLFSMPLLASCFVESDDGEYRTWGSNGDFDALFKIIAHKYKSIDVV